MLVSSPTRLDTGNEVVSSFVREPALYDFDPVVRTCPLHNFIPCICTYYLNCFLLQELNFEPFEKQANINPIWLD